ncbi:MAG: hypothetical protein RLZ98_1582 [Pseudomonadota bacterium]|jgi:endonuclease/exonuclease/phosphatase (EEP) superfamily protein YafD
MLPKRRQRPTTQKPTRCVRGREGRAGALASAGSLAGLAVLSGAIAGIATSEVDAVSLYFDVLAPFRIHFMILAVAGAAAIFWTRRAWLLLMLGLAVSLAGSAAVGLSRQAGELYLREGTVPGGRILFANVWEENADLSRLLSLLRRAPADVVVLAEVKAEWRRSFEQLRNIYPHQQYCTGRPSCQVALLSRLPFRSSGVERATWRHPPVVWAHFGAGVFGPRPMTVVGTHAWRPTRNPWTHRFHLSAIGSLMQRFQGPVVLVGDFNAPAWSQGMKTMIDAAALKVPDCHLPSWPAWPLTLPQFSFDHVLASSDVSVARIGLGPNIGSDHLPVWADIQTRPGIETDCGG